MWFSAVTVYRFCWPLIMAIGAGHEAQSDRAVWVVKFCPINQHSTLRKKFVRYSTNNKYSVGLRMKIERGEENVLFYS